MIVKFLRIARVGKFNDYKPKGDTELRRLTLIYGENAKGKTTVTSILRSLQTGQPHHITGRKKLSQADAPEVELRLSDKTTAKFSNGAWSCSPCMIEVFDATFVHDNVHGGGNVSHAQRRNLYGIIVGEKGVTLSKKVELLDEAIRLANREITVAKEPVTEKIKDGMKIDTFLTLEKVDDVDVQITTQEAEIEALKSAAEIASTTSFSELMPPSLPKNLNDLLAKTLPDVSKDAEQRMANHIKDHLDKKGEAWVKQGYGYLGDGTTCPFCAQDASGSTIVKAYQSYFSEAYAQLQTELTELKRTVTSSFGPNARNPFQVAISGNATRRAFWKRFVKVDLTDVTTDHAFGKLYDLLIEHIDQKIAAPLDSVTVSPEFVTAIGKFEQWLTTVTTYNTACTTANVEVKTKKEKASSGNLVVAQKKHSTLRNAKERHLPEVIALCDTYNAAVKKKEKLAENKDTAKDELDLYSDTIFGKYETAINKYLADFGVDIRISDCGKNYIGGKPVTVYGLTVDGKLVEIGDDDTPLDTPCFRNTLSGGDKSALALAFFLARMEHDEKIGEKCIVFDDPMCSLDLFRKDKTVTQIASVVKKAKQVIVLSHDPHFLVQLFEKWYSAEVRPLYLHRDGDQVVLSEWNFQETTMTQYLRDFHTLKDFLASGKGDHRAIARAIRPLLEENLRVRFPDQFRTGWLGEFIGKIEDAKPGEELYDVMKLVDPLNDINDYSKKYHHSTNPNFANEAIQEAELTVYAKHTLDFIRGAPLTAVQAES